MIEDIVPLDGNAAAGRLGQFFTFDVTLATITCGHCDAVNIRMLETGTSVNLDLSGTARITASAAS